jgi:hypothetical protein
MHFVFEGAAPVAEHDLLVGLLDDVEVAVDAALQVDEHAGDLFTAERVDLQGRAVVAVDRTPDVLADDADEARGFLEADDVLERARELTKDGSKERVAREGDIDGQGWGPWALRCLRYQGRRPDSKQPARPEEPTPSASHLWVDDTSTTSELTRPRTTASCF